MRRPGEVPASTAGIKPQIAGLVRPMVFIKHPGRPISPEPGHALGYPGHGPRIVLARAKVIGGGKPNSLRGTCQQFLSKAKISVHRFKNMLPRANGMRTANTHRLSRKKAADEIRNETVRRPVASAYDVAGTSCCNTNPVFS